MVGGGAVLLLLLLLLAITVIPLTNPHHLHPPLLPADDYCEGQRKVDKKMLMAFALFCSTSSVSKTDNRSQLAYASSFVEVLIWLWVELVAL